MGSLEWQQYPDFPVRCQDCHISQGRSQCNQCFLYSPLESPQPPSDVTDLRGTETSPSTLPVCGWPQVRLLFISRGLESYQGPRSSSRPRATRMNYWGKGPWHIETPDRTVSISSGLLCMQGRLLGPWHLLPEFSTIMAPGDLPTLATRKCSHKSDGTDLQRSCGQGALAKSEAQGRTCFLSPGTGGPLGKLSPPESMGSQEGTGTYFPKAVKFPGMEL